MGRSRSRSYSSSRSRSRSRSPSEELEGTRVHVGELSASTHKSDLENAFQKYGEIKEVWMAQNPPCFGFIVYRRPADAEEACRQLNGSTISGGRIRVSIALPRARQRRQMRAFNADMRCYQCGEKGHFSRECSGVGRNRNRWSPRRSRSTSRSSNSRSRSGSRRRRSSRRRRNSSRERRRSPPRGGGRGDGSRRSRDRRSVDRRSRDRRSRDRRSTERRSRDRRSKDGRSGGRRSRERASRERGSRERRRSKEERGHSRRDSDRKRSRSRNNHESGPTAEDILAANIS